MFFPVPCVGGLHRHSGVVCALVELQPTGVFSKSEWKEEGLKLVPISLSWRGLMDGVLQWAPLGESPKFCGDKSVKKQSCSLSSLNCGWVTLNAGCLLSLTLTMWGGRKGLGSEEVASGWGDVRVVLFFKVLALLFWNHTCLKQNIFKVN